MRRLSTTLPTVPLVVSSSAGVWRVTSTASVSSPTSSAKSMTTVESIWTVTFERAARRKPCRPASTRYSPGGSGSDV